MWVGGDNQGTGLRLQQPLEAVAQHAGLAEHLVRGRGRGRVRVRGRVRASPST